MRDLRVVAAAPRPIGGPGNAAARAYLLAQLAALGLQPDVQTAAAFGHFPGSATIPAGSVNNVVSRLPGTASTGAIVLDAHYDGPTSGPGAADCGSCVVTVLETMRALQAGPPLRNDVIAVFTDGEEVGDLGAAAFMPPK
jgi:acetylornithine deacetylase/succinyl-diaminopimelate desuccinylase-like protein